MNIIEHLAELVYEAVGDANNISGVNEDEKAVEAELF